MGNKKKIKTPEILWEHFKDYVKYVDDNPLLIEDFVGKDGNKVLRRKPVPLTMQGFEVYLSEEGIIKDFSDYVKNKENRYDRYAPIIARIKNYCFVNKFNGAAAGIFQHNIIARELGLTDNTNVTVVAEQPLFPERKKDG